MRGPGTPRLRQPQPQCDGSWGAVSEHHPHLAISLRYWSRLCLSTCWGLCSKEFKKEGTGSEVRGGQWGLLGRREPLGRRGKDAEVFIQTSGKSPGLSLSVRTADPRGGGVLTAESPEPSATSERELARRMSGGWLRPETGRLRFRFGLHHYLFCDLDMSHSLLELRAWSMPPNDKT